jgi:hypothetical protein
VPLIDEVCARVCLCVYVCVQVGSNMTWVGSSASGSVSGLTNGVVDIINRIQHITISAQRRLEARLLCCAHLKEPGALDHVGGGGEGVGAACVLSPFSPMPALFRSVCRARCNIMGIHIHWAPTPLLAAN